ncbi:MAG: VOC family protein [Actinomycetota bacterium]
MPTRTSYAHGTPSWIDLATTDVAGARAFYAELFGWSFEENPTDQGGSYVMASKAGSATAGMMTQPDEQREMGLPPMWNSYVTVDDMAATVGRVEGAGGKVMAPPFDVMDAGVMAVIVDPSGGVISLWQPKEHIGAQVVNEHGALIWNELISPDVPAAAAFYGEVLGWGTQEMDMGEMGTYTVFTLDGEGIGGAMAPPMDGMPPHWGVYFAVDDAEATIAAVTAAGGAVVNPPTPSPPGIIAVVQDPQGAMFSIMQPAEPAS